MGAHCKSVDVHDANVDVQIAVDDKRAWVGKRPRDCIDAQGTTVAWLSVRGRVGTNLGISGRVGLLRTRARMRTGACGILRACSARCAHESLGCGARCAKDRCMRPRARACMPGSAHTQTPGHTGRCACWPAYARMRYVSVGTYVVVCATSHEGSGGRKRRNGGERTELASVIRQTAALSAALLAESRLW